MADTDRLEQRPNDIAGGYSRYTDSENLYREFKESSENGTDKSNEFSESEDRGFIETGWESEREYLFSGEAIEELKQKWLPLLIGVPTAVQILSWTVYILWQVLQK